ncbi:PREDICTED: U-box domain-containing protein 51 isoform X2 [Tarenaya hassleriana]|uniref:U-box domain-containing protein 51 isoform X2 n=1 Tax=Tarenaya hassleriana TaxID=28532 RepID=UPI00053C207F|nr:PREDICTED: U-box domain-containing protein 51 isoform X2 [Tarenaya hassleriana]
MGDRKKPEDRALTVAVAIKGNNISKSKGLVRWAIQQFASLDHVVFKLLHVQPRITSVLTPMGNSIPISSVREDIATVYKEDVNWKTREMLLPYRDMFVRMEVQSDIMMLESDDIAAAISKAVEENGINELIVGASSSSFFPCLCLSRRQKRSNLSSRISDSTPRFCTVHIISKGKLLSVRPPDPDREAAVTDDRSEERFSSAGASHRFPSSPLLFQRLHALSNVNNALIHNRALSFDVDESKKHHHPKGFYRTNSSGIGYAASDSSSWSHSQMDNQTSFSGQGSSSSGYTDSTSSGSQMNVDFELEKLKIELRHVRGMYAMAQTEIMDASRKLQDLNHRRLEESVKLKELTIKEEEAEEAAAKEKEKKGEAEKEAEMVRLSVEREVEERVEAEMRAEEVAREKKRLQFQLEGGFQYVKFAWEEIVEATSSFSEDLKVGMGAYGNVFKCCLHHTDVAVKVLHPDKTGLTKQFEQELEVLSKIRHPHLLLLLGACPERGCLIYEYMHNGSLEERLFGHQTQPLPWFERFRIAWEIASALYFLHTTKPKPIVHRDLKPANILLDRNLVSKIGDVGLSKMVNLDPSHASTLFNSTGPVGTFFYIDPEYQRTGLVSPESDVYAFGIILLQLVTAKPAMALAHAMEKAVREGRSAEMVDATAGDWPGDEMKEIIKLGLRCTELRRRDRPDLGDEILPVLERMKNVACMARTAVSEALIDPPPGHFVCPLRKDIMEDPCVAADGYTYDRRAIEEWLQESDRSPMTDLPFPHTNLLPNHSLLSAIQEWRSNQN